jgi:hypothetical protein
VVEGDIVLAVSQDEVSERVFVCRVHALILSFVAL